MKKEFDQKEWERKERERDEMKRDTDSYWGIRVLRTYVAIAIAVVLAVIILFWDSCGNSLTTLYPNGEPSTTPVYPTTYSFGISVGGETIHEYEVTIPQG